VKPAPLRLLFVLLVIVAGWFGVSRLDFDVDPLSLLPQELPGLQGTRLLREQKRDLLLITVQADDPALVEVTADALAEHLASKPELCASVRSQSLLQSDPAIIAEVVAYLWLNAPPQEVAKLTASLDAASLSALLTKAKETAGTSLDLQNATMSGYDPLGLSRGAMQLLSGGADMSSMMSDEFSSADGTLRLLFVTPPGQALADYRAANAWLTQIKSAVREKWLPQQGELNGVKIGFTGDPAFQAEIATGMEGDMRQSIGAVTFIVGFLFWLLHACGAGASGREFCEHLPSCAARCGVVSGQHRGHLCHAGPQPASRCRAARSVVRAGRVDRRGSHAVWLFATGHENGQDRGASRLHQHRP